MKKLTAQSLLEIKQWMHRNARPVDLKLWQYHFEGGRADAVLQELAYYQNADGGFGLALEPDCWNPESSPYTTLQAIRMMRAVGCGELREPMLGKAFRYLEECAHQREYGWMFSIPTNDGHAHAPWWSFSEEANTYESIGLTAELAGVILLLGEKGSPLYHKAEAYAAGVIEKLKMPGKRGDMGIGGYIELLECLIKAGLQDRFDCDFLSSALNRLVYDTIERDTSKWVCYGVHPARYIQSPDSRFYGENKDIVQAELDFLIDTRPANGIWPIPWSWFENNEKYAKQFAISENWWKAIKGMEKVLLLYRFGRVER